MSSTAMFDDDLEVMVGGDTEEEVEEEDQDDQKEDKEDN